MEELTLQIEQHRNDVTRQTASRKDVLNLKCLYLDISASHLYKLTSKKV
jgi:hypothetical protein